MSFNDVNQTFKKCAFTIFILHWVIVVSLSPSLFKPGLYTCNYYFRGR